MMRTSAPFIPFSIEATVGRIYLVRHGQTSWNEAKIFRGRADIGLSEQGRAEAECAASALGDAPLSGIYASPLSRTRETAEKIAAHHNADVAADPAFLDIDYGEWTGRPDAEVRESFPDLYEQWETSPQLVQFPGGESLDRVRLRAVARLNELARLHWDGTIAVVTHRVVLKVLLCEIKGLDNSRFWDVPVNPAAICVVETDGDSIALTVENDTRHLRAVQDADVADF